MKANSRGELNAIPYQLSYSEFQEWLLRMRKRDKDMQVNMQRIMIKK